MILHLNCDVPKPKVKVLDEASPFLTDEETRIIKDQIRKNSDLIFQYVERLDLLVNKERYPSRAVFIQKIRRRLELLMEENDTFRKVFWKQVQLEEILENASRK